jgi:hypothetical protein
MANIIIDKLHQILKRRIDPDNTNSDYYEIWPKVLIEDVYTDTSMSTNLISELEYIKRLIDDSLSYNIPVLSVNGRTGNVVITKNDMGLRYVNNTSDASKPISNPQQAALDLYRQQLLLQIASLSTSAEEYSDHIANHNNPHNVTKMQMGLGNVENISIVTTVNDAITTHDTSSTAHADIRTQLTTAINDINALTSQIANIITTIQPQINSSITTEINAHNNNIGSHQYLLNRLASAEETLSDIITNYQNWGGAENVVNKTNVINETNKNSDTLYPTLDAISNYITGIAQNPGKILDVQYRFSSNALAIYDEGTLYMVQNYIDNSNQYPALIYNNGTEVISIPTVPLNGLLSDMVITYSQFPVDDDWFAQIGANNALNVTANYDGKSGALQAYQNGVLYNYPIFSPTTYTNDYWGFKILDSEPDGNYDFNSDFTYRNGCYFVRNMTITSLGNIGIVLYNNGTITRFPIDLPIVDRLCAAIADNETGLTAASAGLENGTGIVFIKDLNLRAPNLGIAGVRYFNNNSRVWDFPFMNPTILSQTYTNTPTTEDLVMPFNGMQFESIIAVQAAISGLSVGASTRPLSATYTYNLNYTGAYITGVTFHFVHGAGLSYVNWDLLVIGTGHVDET